MGEVAAFAGNTSHSADHGTRGDEDSDARDHLTVEEETRLIAVTPPVVIVGQATFVIAAVTMYIFFEHLLASWQSRCIATLLILIVLGCSAFDVWLFRGGITGKRITSVWKTADLVLAFTFSLTTTLLVWFALPQAGSAQWLVATAFCVGYVPIQIAASPDNALTGKVSLVIVVGGFFLYLLLHDWRANLALLILLALYGAALFFMSDMFRMVVKGMIVSRRAAERANAELAMAVTAIAAERDAKTRFIAAISHDLAQPLQAARLFTEQAGKANDPWQRDEALRQVQTALKSTQTMLGQLLYHMRLEADEVAPQVRPVRIDRQLRDLAKRNAGAAAAAGMQIKVRCPSLTLASDAVLLDRAVGNLLNNAIVHSGASLIAVVGADDGHGARITVMDNGRGVPPHEADSIFADYTQGSASAARHSGGFGLGLASVVRIARLLGGAAGLRPRRRGAAFWISLPDQEASP